MKKNLLISTLLLFNFFTDKSYAQDLSLNNYILVWSDEFNGNTLDSTKWSHRYLWKRKLGYTTEDSIKVSGGTLKNIIHIKDGKVCSGMIGTQGKFENAYGYFEIKAKLPKIKGPQSAFWLNSSTYGSIIGNPEISGVEIDIMEYIKKDPNKVHFTIHWDGYGSYHKKDYFGFDYPSIQDNNWHTFGLMWDKDSYNFYIDGILRHKKQIAISQVKQYIILSSEIGDWGGGVQDEILPDVFEVDYVRVYKKVN